MFSNKTQTVTCVVAALFMSYMWGKWFEPSLLIHLAGAATGIAVWGLFVKRWNELERKRYVRRREEEREQDQQDLMQQIRDNEDARDELREEEIDAQPDPDVRNPNDTRIVVAARSPNPDPDYEECDAWVNTSLEPPQVYVRVDHTLEDGHPAPSTWQASGPLHQRGKMLVCNGDTMVMMITAKRPGLNAAVRNLTSLDKENMEVATIEVLDTLDPVLRDELLTMTGPHKLPDEEEPEPPGKRAIDVG